MKSLNLLFLLLFAPSVLFANDFLFNRLTKLYQKDPDKCLEVAQRYINYFPMECSSYYYASKVCHDKSKKTKNSRTEYALLKKAIGYAVKFEKTDFTKLAAQVNWDREKTSLKESVTQLSGRLSNENQQSLSANLVISYSKLDAREEANITPKKDHPITADKVEDASRIKGFYYGLPNGTENVRSSNSSEEQALLQMINVQRKKMGLDPLIWEEKLAQAARYHAYDMGSQKYFDHNSYDRINGELVKVGGTFTRIGRFYSASSLNSENIAVGSNRAAGTYEQWYNSKGHYDNLFNKQSKRVGIGFYYDENSPFKFYWVFCAAS